MNHPPIIFAEDPEPGAVTLVRDPTVFQVQASDPDADEIQFVWTDLGDGVEPDPPVPLLDSQGHLRGYLSTYKIPRDSSYDGVRLRCQVNDFDASVSVAWDLVVEQ